MQISAHMPLLRLQGSEGKLKLYRETRPVRRSFCRHRSCRFTEVNVCHYLTLSSGTRKPAPPSVVALRAKMAARPTPWVPGGAEYRDLYQISIDTAANVNVHVVIFGYGPLLPSSGRSLAAGLRAHAYMHVSMHACMYLACNDVCNVCNVCN